mgnify:FL=1
MNTQISGIAKMIETRRKNSRDKNNFYKILIMLTMMIMMVSCGKKDNESEYEVTTVQSGDISLSVSKTGQVVSDNVMSVYTTASQRVSKVFFKEGDNVKKGDVVVTFYPVDKNETLRRIQI